MATASYVVEIDINRNGAYDHANSDVTARVMALNWSNGLSNTDRRVASPARGSLTLDNSDGAFNPEDTGAAYYDKVQRGMLVRIRTTAPETETLFIGKVAGLRLQPGKFGPKTVDLELRDLLLELQEAEYSPPLQIDVRTDEVIQEIFEQAVIALPYPTDYWVLEASGYSELGSTTILLSATNAIALDSGNTTLAYAGDNFNNKSGTSTLQIINDMVAAECGGSAKFFYNTRTGLFTFHSRLRNANASPVSSFSDADIVSADYRYGEEIANSVEVTYTPRYAGVSNSALWELEEAIELSPGQSSSFTAKYYEAGNEDARVGGFDFIAPKPYVHYVANTRADNAGTDLTPWAVVSVGFNGSDAKISVRNGSNQTMFITSITLKGTPLVNYKTQTVEAYNADSIALYSRISKSFNLNALSNREFAQQYASNYIGQYAQPIGQVYSIAIRANDSDTLMSAALQRKVGDLITLTLTDVSHDADYEIIGERHTIQPGGEHRHDVTWMLRPATRQQYWVLGVSGKSELGSTTIPAF